MYFHDAFGHPLVGYLRCSKVYRRTTLQELQCSEGMEELSTTPHGREREATSTTTVTAPPAKKPRSSKSSQKEGSVTPSTTSMVIEIDMPALSTNKGVSIDLSGHSSNDGGSVDDWNLSKFKLLTECASSLTGDEALPSASPNFKDILQTTSSPLGTAFSAEQSLSYSNTDASVATVLSIKGSDGIYNSSRVSNPSIYSEGFSDITSGVSNSNHLGNGGNSNGVASSNGSVTSQNPQNQQMSVDCGEEEFVCVIRTSDNCFAPHRTSNCDLLTFSSLLSTASIVAHDRGLSRGTGTLQENSHPHRRGSSPNGSSGSSSSKNSSDAAPNSDSSKVTNKTCTSSETGSEDNSAETDST